VNVLHCQRVNRAALPHMRRAKRGLLVWIGSSSVAGGVPPLLGPYFAAKAGMDALAVAYVRELAPLGIESAIVVPGAFTTGTNHFANAGEPQDKDRSSDYNQAWPNGFAERVRTALAATVPADADPAEVAHAVAAIVEAPTGKRRFCVVVDPASDGAAVSYAVIDRVREPFLDRRGLIELRRVNRLQ
jgi:NAD(P)-dependent dehydrogenase (short-subunit alcohol dehydrogenase family)